MASIYQCKGIYNCHVLVSIQKFARFLNVKNLRCKRFNMYILNLGQCKDKLIVYIIQINNHNLFRQNIPFLQIFPGENGKKLPIFAHK